MDTFNLNIDAYRDIELENLMGLTVPYSHEDVTDAKEVLLRQLTKDADLEPEKNRELSFFIDSIASRLDSSDQKHYKLSDNPRQRPHDDDKGTYAEKKVPIAQYGSNIIIKNSNEIVGKHAKITQGRIAMSGEVPPGYINPINVRTTARAINIDSRFRPNYYKTSSSKFSMYLPAIEKRVVKMTVGALEIPLTYHAVSENLGNNKCLIIDNCSNFYPDPSGWLVKLPDGNYGTNELKGGPGSQPSTEMDIDIAMNNAIATADAGTVNINTGNFTPTVLGAKLDPTQDICYRWDRISGRSVFACPENAACSRDGVGAGVADWVERYPPTNSPAGFPERRWKGIASDTTGDKLFACTQGNIAGTAEHGLYISDSSGAVWKNTWTAGAPLPFVSDMNWISACSSADGENLGALTFDSSGAFSVNRGDNWTYFTDLSSASPYGVTDNSYNTISSSEEGLVKYVCSANGAIKISTNSGLNWNMCAGVTAAYPPTTLSWTDRSSTGGVVAPGTAWADNYGIASNRSGTTWFAAATTGNFYKSIDSGVTWVQNTASPNPKPWRNIASDEAGLNLAATSNPFFWLSSDSGTTWTQQPQGGTPAQELPTAYDALSVASNGDGSVVVTIAFSGGSQGIWVSWNATSVTPIWDNYAAPAVPGTSAKWVAVTSSRDGSAANATKFAVATIGGFIWHSLDGGQNWIEATAGGDPPSATWKAICSDRTGQNVFAVRFGSNIWKSTGFGATGTWTELAASGTLDWQSIACDDTGTNIVAGGASIGLWTSNDGGTTWSQPSGVPATFVTHAVASNGAGTILGALQDNGNPIWTTALAAPQPPAEWTGICCNTDGARMAVCNTTHIYISADSGATLEQKQIATAPAEWSAIACSDDFVFQVAAEGYGTSTGRVWLSVDGGDNWAAQTNLDGGAAKHWKSVTINSDGKVIAAVVGGNKTDTTATGSIWVSEDSGGTWTKQITPGVKSWQSITSNADGSKLAAAVGDGSQEPTGSIVGNVWTWPFYAPVPGGGSCKCMDYIVRFTIDKKGNLDMNDSIQFKLGWPLGFRAGEYMTSGAAVSEGICFITGPRYGFLAIDDYQKNRGKAHMIAFTNSSLDENIMVRLNLAAVQDKAGVYKSANDPGLTTTMNTSRDYFGPVDIQKLTVTLYDEYGRVIDINNMDWSFTLTLERLYD